MSDIVNDPGDDVPPGPKAWQDYMLGLRDMIIANMPINGRGIRVADSLNGQGRPINYQAGSGGSAQTGFSLYDAGSGQLGITNGILTGPGFQGLIAGMTEGGDPAYTTPVGHDDKYVWIGISWDTSDPINPQITGDPYIDTGATVPDNDATDQYIALGDFSVSGQAITIGSGAIGIGSQTVQACGPNFNQGPS